MSRLVEVLSIERGAEAEGHARAELDVICQGGDTAVVDFGLRERTGVEFVFCRNLQPDIASGSGIPRRLRTSFNLGIDLMVITRGKDTQIIRRRHRRGIAPLTIPRREGVFGDGCFSDVVTTFRTDEEALVSQCDVEGCGGALEEVGEQAGVDVGLFVEEVEFAAVGGFGGEVGGQDLGFEALGQVVFEFELGVQAVGGGPGLSDGESRSLVGVFPFNRA